MVIEVAAKHTPHGRTISLNAPLFSKALFGLLRRPRRLLLSWNWKSALLSTVLRGPIFVVASFRQGWAGAISALLAESAYCAFVSGFYGAVVQALRDARPLWLTGLFLTVVLPGIFQALEYFLHRLRSTPHLRIAEIASIVLSIISGLLNWYLMRSGALLVGKEGRSLGTDLRRLPRLVFDFFTLFLRRTMRPERRGS